MKTTIEYDMWDIAFIFVMSICVSSSPWFLLGVAYGLLVLFAEKRATYVCYFGWTKGKGWWFKGRDK